MNWFGDMLLLFLEWWLLMIIPLILGVLIGYFLWYKKYVEAEKQGKECEKEFNKLEKMYARKSDHYDQKEIDLDQLVVAYDDLDHKLEANIDLLEKEKTKNTDLEKQVTSLKEKLELLENKIVEVKEEELKEEEEETEALDDTSTIDVDIEPVDLTSIEGITSDDQNKLNDEGLKSFKDIALLDEEKALLLEEKLNMEPGTIKTNNWTSKAAQRHFETTGEMIYDDVKIEPYYEHAFEKQLMESSKGVVLDYVDDLKVIKGVGPKMEKILQSFGVKTYFQLSVFDDQAIAALNDAIDTFPGRIERDEWIKQAKELHNKYHKA